MRALSAVHKPRFRFEGGLGADAVHAAVERRRRTLDEGELTRRPATPEDKEFARLVHHLAYHEVVLHQFGRWDEREQDAYFAAAWPKHDHEIVEWNGEACGYVAVELGCRRVDVHELVLHPDHHNRGIGTTILLEAVSAAGSLGASVHLQVLHANRAVALYERLGFEQSGETATHRQMRLIP